MKFHATKLAGVYEIEAQRIYDERGFFARSWCREEFTEHGLDPSLAQCNISYNTHKGTLRGMHYQAAPHGEKKLIRCTKGSVYDVVVDLRTGSPTFREWVAVVLSDQERNMIYVPEGCGHGFLTLDDGAEIFYQMSASYNPAAARGVRWNDAAFAIDWPAEVRVISERDRTYPDFVS